MKSLFLKTTITLMMALILSSCTTYIIPVESLKAQFSEIDSTDFVNVVVSGPVGGSYNYLANPIKSISCIDKHNNQVELINSPSIEMRVTENGNRKTIFYFDRIFVSKSYLYGVQSRFAPSITRTIPLKDITKIEVQDGKKNFKYITK